MTAAIIVLICVQPIPYAEYFDEAALPSVTVDDLDRFHDALLALRHGATAHVLRMQLQDLESRSWDMGGKQAEYKATLEYLRWSAECWYQLEMVITHRNEDLRAQSLTVLRKRLGPSFFYAGRMPPHPGNCAVEFVGLPMPREVR